MLTPGHVAVFGGWANRGKRTFIVLEEGRKGAVRRVRRMERNAKGLRYRGITEPVLVAAAPMTTAAVATGTIAAAALPSTVDASTTTMAVTVAVASTVATATALPTTTPLAPALLP